MSAPLVEFVGLPGAGKTHYAKRLSKLVGWSMKYRAIAREPLNQLANSHLRHLLSSDGKVLKAARLYDSWAYDVIKRSAAYQDRLVPVTRALAGWCLADGADIRQMSLIARSLERDLVLSWAAEEAKLAIVNDDGVLQRLVSICGLRGGDPKGEAAHALSDTIIGSLPAGVRPVVVTVPVDEAIRRVRARPSGVPELLGEDTFRLRMENAAAFVALVEQRMAARGLSVLRLDGTRPSEENLGTLTDRWGKDSA